MSYALEHVAWETCLVELRPDRDLLRAQPVARGPAAAQEARLALFRAGLSEEKTKEIAFTVAMTDFSNRIHTIAAIPARRFERSRATAREAGD
jgi:hypothetical protein